MPLILSSFHLLQACLGLYTGLLSYTSIVKLQKHEKPAEKAAQYSKTAEDQLFKTRTTQASGAITTISSLASSIYLISSVHSKEWTVPLIICTVNVIGLGLAHVYITGFWKDKVKIPLVKDYSDAITTSNQMRQFLGILGVSWFIASLAYLMRAVGT